MTDIQNLSENSNNNEQTVSFFKIKKRKNEEKIEIIHAYINGVIKNNKGYWAFIYTTEKNEIFSFSGEEENIDKNRINLIPLLELLEWINEIGKKKNLVIYTTNLYIVNCLNEWMNKWKKNNFQINEIKERPNADLLRKIEELKSNINITINFLMIENDLYLQTEKLIENYLDFK